MNLEFLDKKSQVTPLLVQLFDSQKLHALANDKQPLARTQLTHAVTELLEMDVSPRETELISDILIELMRQAEVDIRQALSERLSVMENIPLRLVLQIANDEIIVAHPMLKNSPVLSDLDLIYIIKSKTPEYWRSIAQRKILDPLVINSLSKTHDQETCLTLIHNNDIEIPQRSYLTLCGMAQNSSDIAHSLSARKDVPEDLKAEIYKLVGKEIKQSLPTNQEEMRTNIDEIVEELSGENIFEPTKTMKNTARRLQKRREITIDMMIGVLRRGQFPSFIAQFAEFTAQSTDVVAALLKQESGQGLAVSCKALGVEKYDFVSMFLLTHKMRKSSHMTEVSELGKAVEYFNRIDKKTAKKILKGK